MAGDPQVAGSKPLPGKREAAAMLCAEDRLPDHAIAARIGVSRRSLTNWRTGDGAAALEFQARVAFLVEVIRKRIEEEAIADQRRRVAAQGARWRDLHAVFAARADEFAAMPPESRPPGWETGLLCRQVKFVKVFELTKAGLAKVAENEEIARRNQAILARLRPGDVVPPLEPIAELTDDDFIATKQTAAVEEFAIDTAAMAEARALEDSAARELGQRIERTQVNASVELVEQAARTLDEKLMGALVAGSTESVPVEPDAA